jgi:acyl-CoA reductase-like NAD-dependent aldehyde dehydrogenase
MRTRNAAALAISAVTYQPHVRYTANAAELLADEAVDLGPMASGYILHLPIGTVLAVMPWNLPLWQVTRAAVPILAVGNGILLKHADNVQGARNLADAFRAEDSLAAIPPSAGSLLSADRAGRRDTGNGDLW